ncbi:Two domain fusion protein [Desulfosarcina cetonica]|uniref:Lrp/AsnC ligand binding domain-containing protein n=1 Tax=Desulfosarcina cetonica TaxID=90730 RepID=UPI000A41D5CD|nr:Lrp/AsnC ligand binding domain-containing protein [Desulfosarcina cetonica]VTR65750.1 Two domain fusion protein [Desulfosarcina cetonica]
MGRLTDLIKKWWTGERGDNEAKCFRDDQACEGAFDHIDRGICAVPLDRIVGSVGRYHDFDSQFKLKDHMPADRLVSIKRAMRQGHSLPPVKLYKIKDEYYVLDGNHRIAAAKSFGRTDILAKIVEFIPSSNTLENIIYREKSHFMEQTGLNHPIELSEVGQFPHLMEQIEKHKRFLETTENPSVTMTMAAEDWYQTIYLPLTEIIRKGRLLTFFQGRTLDDLYAYISYHQWEKGRTRKYGIGIDKLIPNSMEAFRKKMAKMKKEEYPEMLRGITAFIMITAEAKRETKVVDRLFALPEVREVHSVHGSIDILVKITLTRDLLTSDAEVIGQFVQEKIRQIPGILSTQTLIPGQSRIKPADPADPTDS